MIQDLKTLAYMAFPPKGDSHQERMENFYTKQAAHYDKFRENFLRGRGTLYKKALSYNSKGHWLDIGCGTASHFDHLTDEQMNGFDKVNLVDASQSLLDLAQKRLQTRQIERVSYHCCDIHNWQPQGSLDLVTFSYSLTMIPRWPLLLEKVDKWLKPGGLIALVDFYVSEKYPEGDLKKHSLWQRHFWPLWFSRDNVKLSSEQLPYLMHKFKALEHIESETTLPFLPWARVPYYIYLGQKSKA